MNASRQPRHAAGELTNLVTASKNTLRVTDTCVVKYLQGDRELPEDLQELPNPFILEEELPRLLEGLDPDAPAGSVEAPAGGPSWLPGLAFAHVGQPYNTNDFQVSSTFFISELYHHC